MERGITNYGLDEKRRQMLLVPKMYYILQVACNDFSRMLYTFLLKFVSLESCSKKEDKRGCLFLHFILSHRGDTSKS